MANHKKHKQHGGQWEHEANNTQPVPSTAGKSVWPRPPSRNSQPKICYPLEAAQMYFYWLNTNDSQASFSFRFNMPISRARGEIWKRSFIFTVRRPVHANPSRKRSFWKSSSNRRNSKTPAFRFRVGGQGFENGGFQKRWHIISLAEFSSLNTNPTWSVIVTF